MSNQELRGATASPQHWDGWADQRLGQIYDLICKVQADLDSGNTESGCLSDALKAVELADVHIEKREREA